MTVATMWTRQARHQAQDRQDCRRAGGRWCAPSPAAMSSVRCPNAPPTDSAAVELSLRARGAQRPTNSAGARPASCGCTRELPLPSATAISAGRR